MQKTPLGFQNQPTRHARQPSGNLPRLLPPSQHHRALGQGPICPGTRGSCPQWSRRPGPQGTALTPARPDSPPRRAAGDLLQRPCPSGPGRAPPAPPSAASPSAPGPRASWGTPRAPPASLGETDIAASPAGLSARDGHPVAASRNREPEVGAHFCCSLLDSLISPPPPQSTRAVPVWQALNLGDETSPCTCRDTAQGPAGLPCNEEGVLLLCRKEPPPLQPSASDPGT